MLDEAIAKLDEAITKYQKLLRETAFCGISDCHICEPRRHALDAAVYEVAAAAVHMMPDERGFIGGDKNNLGEFVNNAASRRVIAKLKDRLLPEGSEGAKDDVG